MIINEIIDLSKPFENKVDSGKAAVKGFQLEKYFTLDDIKIKKLDGGIDIHTIYRHNKSGERIDILWISLGEHEKSLYKMFNNRDALKYFMGVKKLPHNVDDLFQNYQEWEFDLLSKEN